MARLRLMRQKEVERHGVAAADMRVYNERLVLDLIRRCGPLSRAELSRRSGLSAQSASVIAESLESAHLIRRLPPLKGKVGQPSVPLEIDPDGAFFGGLRIGRRGADLLLLDLSGEVRFHKDIRYDWPDPEAVMAWAADGLRQAKTSIAPHSDRVRGLGVALPFRLWQWASIAQVPLERMETWRTINIADRLAIEGGLPVELHNDASSACAAELMFGDRRMPRHSIYLFVGTFIGGGIVIDGRLMVGATGNAGAVGSLLVPGEDGRPRQLIELASLIQLEHDLAASGFDAAAILRNPEEWNGVEAFERWSNRAAKAISHAVHAAAALLDCTSAVIDGPFPPDMRELLCVRVRENLVHLDHAGINPPSVVPGSIGPRARAMGAAGLLWRRMFDVDFDKASADPVAKRHRV